MARTGSSGLGNFYKEVQAGGETEAPEGKTLLWEVRKERARNRVEYEDKKEEREEKQRESGCSSGGYFFFVIFFSAGGETKPVEY